jgi:hypothetical protein
MDKLQTQISQLETQKDTKYIPQINELKNKITQRKATEYDKANWKRLKIVQKNLESQLENKKKQLSKLKQIKGIKEPEERHLAEALRRAEPSLEVSEELEELEELMKPTINRSESLIPSENIDTDKVLDKDLEESEEERVQKKLSTAYKLLEEREAEARLKEEEALKEEALKEEALKEEALKEEALKEEALKGIEKARLKEEALKEKRLEAAKAVSDKMDAAAEIKSKIDEEHYLKKQQTKKAKQERRKERREAEETRKIALGKRFRTTLNKTKKNIKPITTTNPNIICKAILKSGKNLTKKYYIPSQFPNLTKLKPVSLIKTKPNT